MASELLALQQKNRQAEIDLLKEGSEKKRRQIQENYKKEMEELAAQEKKWRDAQKGHGGMHLGRGIHGSGVMHDDAGGDVTPDG